MSGIEDIPTQAEALEDRFPGVARNCLLNCPVIKMFIERDDSLRSAQEAAGTQSLAMIDDIEGLIKQFFGEVDVTDDDLEEMKRTLRGDTANFLDAIDAFRQDTKGLVQEHAKDCQKPIDLMGEDNQGRKVGALICASKKGLPSNDTPAVARVIRFGS